MSKEEARSLYIAWLARENPRVYERVVAVAQKASLNRKLAGLGALSGWLDTLVNAAVTVGGTLVAKKQADKAADLQKKQQAADLQLALLGVNTQRAQAGLPPVDINGKIIPSATLPAPAALNSPGAVVAQAAEKMSSALPWIFGGVGALLALYLVVRRGH